MLFPTLNFLPASGAQMIPPNIFKYGTNPWPLLTYPALPLPTLTSLRSSPFTALTASHYHPTRDQTVQELTPGWLYPILTVPLGHSSEDKRSYNNPGDDSPLTPMPQTQTLRSPTSSPIRWQDSLPASEDLIHFDTITTEGPETQGIPYIPMDLITSGLNLPPSTKRYSVPNIPLPGTSGGRTLNNDSSTETAGSKSPWSSSSLSHKETQSRGKEVSGPYWPSAGVFSYRCGVQNRSEHRRRPSSVPRTW